jgi:hypothetical protein
MNRQEFEHAFRELVRGHGSRSANERCVACDRCERCTDCTFCSSSVALVRCHYCVDSADSVDCTHCRGVQTLVGCTHCRGSERCTNSAYLSYCVDCADCTYCFGCVGLANREFYILNEPYDRSTYFKVSAALAEALGDQPLDRLVRR